MLLSVMLANEHVPRKSFLGIIIAAIGGFLIIFLPLISSGAGNGAVNPLATLFAVINAVASPMMYIMAKKSVDAGMKIWTSLGVVAWALGDCRFGLVVLVVAVRGGVCVGVCGGVVVCASSAAASSGAAVKTRARPSGE